MATSWSSADAPPFLCIFGPPGVGKTTDLVRAVGVSAIIAAAEGALKPVTHELGFSGFVEYPVKTIEDGTKALLEAKVAIAKMPPERRPRWFLADEFSYMSDRTLANAEKTRTGYQVFGKVREEALRFRDAAREVGIGVIVNAWDMPFHVKQNGKKVRSGPRLSGDLPDYFPGITDGNLFAEFNPAIKPWGAQYRVIGSGQDGMKVRFPCPDPAPMNLRVILAEAGEWGSPYPFPWMADTVRAMTDTLLGVDDTQLLAGCEELYLFLLERSVDPRHAKWVVADARDTVRLRRANAKKWASFAGGGSATTSLPSLN